MKENISTKLSKKIKLAYGSIEFTNSAAYLAFISFGLYYLTDVVGMNPSIAGTLIALGSVANAIGGPLAGIVSDNCRSKYGRRRPFIIACSIPYCIIGWLLFTDFGLGTTETIVYYVIFVFVYFFISAFVDVPYTSLGAEITTDYDERTSLNTYRSVFCQGAGIIGGAFPISIAAAIGLAIGNEKLGWSAMAAIFAVTGIIVVFLGWRGTRGQEKYREDNERIKLKDFADAFKNKAFVYTFLLYSAGVGAYTVALAVQVYFFTYVGGFSEAKITTILVVYNLAAMAWLPLIPVLSKKFSKKVAWVVMMSIWGISVIVQTIFLDPGEFIFMLIAMTIAAAGSMVAYTVGWSMLPDCIEVDEFKTGQRREGLYYGILTIIQKASGALLTWATGITLTIIGYDGIAEVQAASTITGIRMMYMFGALIFIALSFVFIYLYPINRDNHSKLLEALEAKREGREYSTEGIEHLIK